MLPSFADTYVAHCHTTYRFFEPQRSAAQAVQARLDRVLRENVLGDWESALQQALADDPAVYVLRQIDLRLWLNAGDEADTRIGQHWGRQLASAVVQTIAAAPADGRNLVRFADRADYAAHFMIDLLHGSAWQCWYYHAFHALRGLDTSAALTQVLVQHSDQAAAIMGRLYDTGQLDEVLTAFSSTDLRRVWTEVFEGGVTPAPEALRPLFAAAWQLAASLDLWRNSAPDQAHFFDRYNAARPAVLDWRDARSLAQAVLSVLSYLQHGGYLNPSIDLGGAEATSQLDAALAGLDWLDTDWLRVELPRLLSRDAVPASDLPVRRSADDWTPRQRRLLGDLIEVLKHDRVELNRLPANVPAYALSLYAALIAHAPHWADDHLAITLIGQLLEHWAQQPTVPTTAGQTISHSSATFEMQRSLFELLTRRVQSVPKPGVATVCAGAYLLLRAILDLHLPQLIEDAQYPPGLNGMLWALCARWCGVEVDQTDQGLLALIGARDEADAAPLQTTWAKTTRTDHARLQAIVLQRLALHHVVQGTRLHVYRVPIADGAVALIGGDASLNVWPLGCVLTPNDADTNVIAEWRDRWAATVGQLPEIVADDTPNDEAIEREHALGRESLLAALAALHAGQMNLPEADLTVALVAIAVLRVWARWLRQFAASGVPYLLTNFIRRGGTVWPHERSLTLELTRRSLDIVIEMAGYTAVIEHVPWLDDRRVQFEWREGS